MGFLTFVTKHMVLPFCYGREKVHPCLDGLLVLKKYLVSGLSLEQGQQVDLVELLRLWETFFAQSLSCRTASALSSLFFHVICNMDIFLFIGVGVLFYMLLLASIFLYSRLTLGLFPTLYNDENLVGKLQWMSRIAEQFVYFSLGSLWFPWARSLATFGAEETSLPVRVTGGSRAQLCFLRTLWAASGTSKT